MLHRRSAISASDYLDNGSAEIDRTESVHERVQPGVDVGHPERGSVQILGNYFRTGQTDVEDEVKRHPADHVGEDNVGQRDKGFSTLVRPAGALVL